MNAGKYNQKITIYEIIEQTDNDGFKIPTKFELLSCYASVKTLRGYTLIANNSDFEKAFTNFTIRYSQEVEKAYYHSNESNRDLQIQFKNKSYKIEYLNNIDELNIELEMQCKEVMK